MSRKITKKEIRSSDRTKECELFLSILRGETNLRGLVLHSKGQGHTGKTTLLKMFENDCQTVSLPHPTKVLFFTANNRLLEWQMILDRTVDLLGLQHFRTYTRLRESFIGNVKEASKSSPASTYVTNIQNIQGSVHTGSGDIKSTQVSATASEQSDTNRSAETSMSKKEIRNSLTQAFLQELNNLSEPLQLVWLVDTTERLDESTLTWLINIFDKIVEGVLDSLVLVVAGRELLSYEPYWIDRIEELYVGDFDEEIVLNMVQRIWPTEHQALLKGMVQLLMKESGGRPMDLITQIERFNPYD